MGRVVTVTDAVGDIDYDFNSLGQLATVTDSLGQVTTNTYPPPADLRHDATTTNLGDCLATTAIGQRRQRLGETVTYVLRNALEQTRLYPQEKDNLPR